MTPTPEQIKSLVEKALDVASEMPLEQQNETKRLVNNILSALDKYLKEQR